MKARALEAQCPVRDPRHAAEGPLGGAIFETAVLGGIATAALGRGEEPRVHFWRTAAGVEVDFVVEAGPQLVPIEVKLSATPLPAMANGIHALRGDLGERVTHGYVVHPGSIRLPLSPEVTALPFREL